jgi:hypothetical protein
VGIGGAKREEWGCKKSKKGDSLSHYYLSYVWNKLKNNVRVEQEKPGFYIEKRDRSKFRHYLKPMAL